MVRRFSIGTGGIGELDPWRKTIKTTESQPNRILSRKGTLPRAYTRNRWETAAFMGRLETDRVTYRPLDEVRVSVSRKGSQACRIYAFDGDLNLYWASCSTALFSSDIPTTRMAATPPKCRIPSTTAGRMSIITLSSSSLLSKGLSWPVCSAYPSRWRGAPPGSARGQSPPDRAG